MSYGLECVIPFEYGHRLLKHHGKCRHLHGHSGIVTLILVASHLDQNDFVMDLGDVKEIARTWINEHWDHALLLNEADPLVGVLTRAGENQRLYLMEGDPSAENMAQELFERLKVQIPDLIGVVVQETATGRASYQEPIIPMPEEEG